MATQSKEAPGDLAAVRAFVNTRDIDHGVEQLDTPEALVAWLAGHGLLDEGRDGPARRRAAGRALPRGAARAAAEQQRRPTSCPWTSAGRWTTWPPALACACAWTRAGWRVCEAEGDTVDAALGRLLVIVYRAMENDTWPRLKACREDTCKWAFYDHSKNRSGHWCSMEVCGSRHKARQYRERRKSV